MFWGHVLCLARRLFFRSEQQKEEQVLQEEEGYENPYLGQLRRIMEQILEQKKISYGQFAPVFLDGADSQYALWAANLLGRDLNRLTILTEHPAYFERFEDNMYEEHGMIAEVFFKERRKLTEIISDAGKGCVILDFEKPGEGFGRILFEKKLYIPVFKKRWESAGNLDIAVPIGYNTMIVRGSEEEETQLYFDKFERAFYENEY